VATGTRTRQTRNTDDIPAEYWYPDGAAPGPGWASTRLRLVMWDLDLLVPTGHVDAELHRLAAGQVVGWPATAPDRFAGLPDPGRAVRTLEANGLPYGAAVLRLPAALAGLAGALYRRGLKTSDIGTNPAISRCALEAVRRLPGSTQAVVSGTIRTNALRKIGAAGLAGALAADVATYGSEHCRWPDLVRLAIGRASTRYGLTGGPGAAVVVTANTALAAAAGQTGAGCVLVGRAVRDVLEAAEFVRARSGVRRGM